MDLLIPTLAEPLPKRQLEKLIADPNYRGEVKLDGERLLVHVDNGNVIPVNRSGATTTLPSRMIGQAFASLTTGQWAFDGEVVDHQFYIFDMPVAGTAINPQSPFEDRRAVLEQFMSRWNPGEGINLITSFRDEQDKRDLMARVLAHGGEGIMLKDVRAAYIPGKRTDSIRKVKFWASCEVIVTGTGIDGKSNATMAMIDPDGGTIVDVGTVSTLGKWSTMVNPGDVLEVKYLYSVNPSSPKLYQPNILRIRHDKKPEECTIDQLKYTNKTVTEIVT